MSRSVARPLSQDRRSAVADLAGSLAVQDGTFAFLICLSRLLANYDPITVAFFLALTLAYCALRPRQLVATVSRTWLLLLFPVMAAASFLWAEYPQPVLRAGIQVCLTVLAGLMLAHSPRPRAVLVGVGAAFVAYTVASLAAGNTTRVGLYGSALVGLGGEAKNFFSGNAGAGLLTAIALAALAWTREYRLVALGLLGAAVLCGLAVLRADSAGGLVAAAVSTGLLIALLVSRSWSPAIKISALAVGLSLVAVIIAVRDTLLSIIVEAFGKDPGLTGRDMLWEEGYRQVAERPFFGIGYYGFWLPSNPDAVRLWREFQIEQYSSGFNFHNTYIHTMVELGYVGLAALLVGWSVGAVLLLRRFILGSSVVPCLWLSFFVAEMVKTGAEVLRPITFSAPTILLYLALGYGFAQRQKERAGEPALSN